MPEVQNFEGKSWMPTYAGCAGMMGVADGLGGVGRRGEAYFAAFVEIAMVWGVDSKDGG
jgi:hypothetical protein